MLKERWILYIYGYEKIWNVQLKLLKEFQIICKKITLYIMHVEEPYLELLDIRGIFHGMMI